MKNDINPSIHLFLNVINTTLNNHVPIPTRILGDFKKEQSKPLSDVINISFLSGIFRNSMKLAKFVPVYKKRRTSSKQIYQFQFGFRSKHSTSHALISLAEKICATLNKNTLACSVFTDLSKVFDTVKLNILTSKLEYYNVHGIPLAWFKSYLQNRLQYGHVH